GGAGCSEEERRSGDGADQGDWSLKKSPSSRVIADVARHPSGRFALSCLCRDLLSGLPSRCPIPNRSKRFGRKLSRVRCEGRDLLRWSKGLRETLFGHLRSYLAIPIDTRVV